jgi:ABC-2 type transport system permease protein
MGAIGLAWEQFRIERKMLWRNPSAAFFNVVLPLLLLVLLASVFASEDDELEVIVPGIAAMSVMATTFNGLVMHLVALREHGILKRVRGTPIPAASFLAGMIGSAVVNAFAQVGLVVVIGNVLFGVGWPNDWPLLVGFVALGVVCFGALGIAFAHAIPNLDAAPAWSNAIFLPVIFVSGVFYSSDSLPRALDVAAQALPLKHVVDGLAAAVVGESVDTTTAALVVAAWAVAGVLLAVRYFRWE